MTFSAKRPVAVFAALMVCGAAPMALSPAGQKLFDGWKASIQTVRARQSTLTASRTVAEELARRVELDQAGRVTLGPIFAAPLPPSEKSELKRRVFDEIRLIDEENLRYLKSVLPPDGWFQKSRDGAAVASDAWLIVQHTSDHAFQKEVLAKMAPLVAKGEASGPDYALLYDRTEMSEGRPQKYGSQGQCHDGVMVLYKLLDPDRVDDLRRSVGLTESFAAYEARLGVGQPC